MRRRWWRSWPAIGCLFLPAGLVATLIVAAIGTTFVPAAVTGMFPPTRANLTRTWTCRYPYDTETDVFQSDGVCQQSITFDSGRTLHNAGQWSFHPSDGHVWLTNVTVVDNAFGAPRSDLAPTPALWGMAVRRSVTGSVYLVVNEDVDLYFK